MGKKSMALVTAENSLRLAHARIAALSAQAEKDREMIGRLEKELATARGVTAEAYEEWCRRGR
jgi:hypothetical protein